MTCNHSSISSAALSLTLEAVSLTGEKNKANTVLAMFMNKIFSKVYSIQIKMHLSPLFRDFPFKPTFS